MELRPWRWRQPEARAADLTGFIGPSYATYPASSGWAWNTSDPIDALRGTGAVYACVSLLADSIGSLPLHLFSLDGDERRTRIRSGDGNRGRPGIRYPGSLARLLDEAPNPEMTEVDFRSTLVGHQALWGTAYVEVIRDEGGRPKELWPLRPDKIEPKRDENGTRFYRYTVEEFGQNRKVIDLPYDRVMRLPWYGTDGVTGISPISVERLTVQGEQAAQKFQRNWFGNAAMPSSIVTIPPGPQERFKDRAADVGKKMTQLYSGSGNAGRIAVVEQGTDWKAVQMAFSDMQFIEQRRYTVEQVARLYRIPTALMGMTEKQTSYGTGVEAMGLFFLTYTVRPILKRWESAINHDLGLVPGEKLLSDEHIYAEFQTADLLRTDLKSRYEAYSLGIQSQFLNPETVAALENLPYDASRPTAYENPNTKADVPADVPAAAPVEPEAAAAPREVEDREDERLAEEARRTEEVRRTDALLAAVSNMAGMHAADMQALSEVKRAEVTGVPDVNVTVPEAIVSLPSDLRLPTPEVHIDTQPFADSLRFLGRKLEEIDARAEARDTQLRDALERKPTKRVVVRDDHSNIVEIREVPEEDTA